MSAGQVGQAVLATLRYTGLRRNEVFVLRLDGVNLDARRLSVAGKADKLRNVPSLPRSSPSSTTSARSGLRLTGVLVGVGVGHRDGGQVPRRHTRVGERLGRAPLDGRDQLTLFKVNQGGRLDDIVQSRIVAKVKVFAPSRRTLQ